MNAFEKWIYQKTKVAKHSLITVLITLPEKDETLAVIHKRLYLCIH